MRFKITMKKTRGVKTLTSVRIIAPTKPHTYTRLAANVLIIFHQPVYHCAPHNKQLLMSSNVTKLVNPSYKLKTTTRKVCILLIQLFVSQRQRILSVSDKPVILSRLRSTARPIIEHAVTCACVLVVATPVTTSWSIT